MGRVRSGTRRHRGHSDAGGAIQPSRATLAAFYIKTVSIYVDDRNSDAAAGYWTVNWRGGFEQETSRWRMSEFVRVDNLANRAYVGSVTVNETNSRFFEAAPGRAAYIMFNAALRN